MRSIVINAEDRTVSETDIDASLHSLQEIVGGLIDPVYPGLEGTGHHCYVNDEGLLNDPQHFFMLKDGHQPLAGNGVILSTTGDGDEAPCALPLHWVKERVTFMDLQAVRAWVAHEPSQEAFGSFIGEAEVTDSKSMPDITIERLKELQDARDNFVLGTPEGNEIPDPEGWLREYPEDAAELEYLEENAEAADSKAAKERGFGGSARGSRAERRAGRRQRELALAFDPGWKLQTARFIPDE